MSALLQTTTKLSVWRGRKTNFMDFAKLFTEARGKLSQREAAAKVAPELSVRTVQDWESGRRTPPLWVQWLVLGRLKRAAK